MDYDYFECKIPCNKDEVASIEDFMLAIGACSVTFRDAQNMAILEPIPGEMPLWHELEITAMFSKEIKQDTIKDKVKAQYPKRDINIEKLENQVWERTWLEHFKPMLFGENTWIIPSEFAEINPQAVNIHLDPGLAFGTGTHATTSLCLQWIDANDLNDLRIIDFGCGSGILAIAALKHGAEIVYCTDIDSQAIESTLSNAKNNSVDAGIEIVESQQIPELENLDVVMANILAAPLLSLVDTFAKMLKPQGQLIMSGILSEQTDEIIAKFSEAFIDFQVVIEDDWSSVYCLKKG